MLSLLLISKYLVSSLLIGEFIAQKLGISIRFVGEEPNDHITNQYNSYMKEKLPLYGVKLIEIPRLKKGASAISAKRVRELIAQKKLDEVKTLVPFTTYQYISQVFEER